MLNLFLDFIFPQDGCALCRKKGFYGIRRPWCDECKDKLHKLSTISKICDHCGKYLEEDENICCECREQPPPFAICRAVGPYKDSYRVAIKVLKFFVKKNVSYTMGNLMAERVKKEERFWPIDLIIPVPSSELSLTQRGFSQTLLLARQIGRSLGVKVETEVLMRRKENLPHQRGLSRDERIKNLTGAFYLMKKERIANKSILLVDDVFTTGATVRECSRVLMEAKTKKIAIITWSTGIGF